MKGEKETEREYQDLLGCYQGLEGSQTCHASCSDPGESPAHAWALWFCPVTSLLCAHQTMGTLMAKELAFLGPLLLETLIFLEGVFCEH